MNLEVDGIGNTVICQGAEVFDPGLDYKDSGVKGVEDTGGVGSRPERFFEPCRQLEPFEV